MVRHSSRSCDAAAPDLRAATSGDQPAAHTASGQPLLDAGLRALSRSGLLVCALALCLIGPRSSHAASPRRDLRAAANYLAQGRYKVAARAYDRAYAADTSLTQALVGAAEAWSLDGDAAAALSRAEQARKLGLDGWQAALGRSLLVLGRGKEAIAPLTGIDQPRLLALADLAAGDLPAAMAALPATGTTPETDLLSAWLMLELDGVSRCNQALRLTQAAVTAADRAGSLPPHASCTVPADAAAIIRLCATEGSTEGTTDSAAALTAQAHDLRLVAKACEATDPVELITAADVRRDGGDPHGAALLLSRAFALYPKDGRIAYDLGGTWMVAQHYDQAARTLALALPLAPFDQDMTAHHPIVDFYSVPDPERAALVGRAWDALALARDGSGDATGAASAAERAVLVRPDVSSADWVHLAQRWNSLGNIAGNADHAIEAANRAIRLDHANAPAWSALAVAQLAQALPREALNSARKAWSLQPDDPNAAVILVQTLMATGNGPEARRLCESTLASQEDKSSPVAGVLLALLARLER